MALKFRTQNAILWLEVLVTKRNLMALILSWVYFLPKISFIILH
jgi:hypothetical protein